MITPLALACLGAGLFQAETGSISGVVLDAEDRQPVQFVIVSLSNSEGAIAGTVPTDSLGGFFFSDIEAKPHTLYFQRAGYRNWTRRDVVPGSDGAKNLIVILVAAPFVSTDTVFVSVSRTPEPQLRAPGSTSLITRKTLEQGPMLTPVDHTRTVTGVDFASKGMIQHTFAVRGHRSVNSGALLVMTDYRYAGVPALDINVPYLLAVSRDDIDRIEVARGPSSALYGPNSDRGVLHILTRSPFESKGTSISLSMGERDVLQGRIRHAGTAGTKFAYKLSAEYFRGDDWEFVDSTEAAEREEAIDAGADPDTLRIGQRDNRAERVGGELRVDWKPAARSVWTLTGGIAQAVNVVDLTTSLGGVQVQDWIYPYLQLQTTQGEFYANVLYNGSNSGDTYALRTGDDLVDESRMAAIQLQHGSRIGSATSLKYGVDARRTEPRTRGTINNRNEENDTMSELGAYLSANSPVGDNLTLVGALRGDYHDRINDVTLSPRLGVVFHPSQDQSLRFTYNRAFSSPDAASLFMDVRVGSEGPYTARASSVPKDGFTFDGDCGGWPCMQTPWESLPPDLPADATQTWDELVQLLDPADSIGLGQIPAPTSSEVGTDLRSLNLETFRFDLPGDVQDVPGPRRVIRNTLEAGYKGIVGERALVHGDVYWTHITDNKGPSRTITPNVFFNQASLEAYLANFMTPAEAAALAEVAAGIPMGTVSPDQVGASTDILVVNHQVADYSYSFWGIDLGFEMQLSTKLTLGGDYSYFNENVIDGVDVVGTVVLSVPNHKGAAWIRYRNDRSGWYAGMTGRALDGFLVNSGVYQGEVDAYSVLDLNLGYRLIRVPRMVIALDATNVFDKRHQEYVGGAEIGRLIMVKLQMEL